MEEKLIEILDFMVTELLFLKDAGFLDIESRLLNTQQIKEALNIAEKEFPQLKNQQGKLKIQGLQRYFPVKIL